MSRGLRRHGNELKKTRKMAKNIGIEPFLVFSLAIF
jgi:hypothetical protein